MANVTRYASLFPQRQPKLAASDADGNLDAASTPLVLLVEWNIELARAVAS